MLGNATCPRHDGTHSKHYERCEFPADDEYDSEEGDALEVVLAPAEQLVFGTCDGVGIYGGGDVEFEGFGEAGADGTRELEISVDILDTGFVEGGVGLAGVEEVFY